MDSIARILDFWFGELDGDGMADADTARRWWKKDPDFDAEIRERFDPEYQAIAAGEREEWLDTPRGTLAYLIVIDQLARNMFRGTPDMYAADDRALAAVEHALERGLDRQLPTHHRVFLYLPLMHAESLEHQRRCVSELEKLAAEQRGSARERIEGNLDFARRHLEVVERFGRFPHRNEILGRDSTAEELEYLSQPGAGF